MLISNIHDLEKDSSVDLYSCGSARLSHEIRTKLNIVPVNIYKHRETGKIINVFIMTNELSKFLVEWSNKNPRKKGGA